MGPARTAGEMSRIHDHPEIAQEAKRGEARVNKLGKQHPEFIGLCLYPIQITSPKSCNDIPTLTCP